MISVFSQIKKRHCLFVCNMPASPHLAQVCVLFEPLQPALVVLLSQRLLDVCVTAGMQCEGWVAVGRGLWVCSLQGFVEGNCTLPPGGGGQVRLLLQLQSNGAQTMNCREGKREQQVIRWKTKRLADRTGGGLNIFFQFLCETAFRSSAK